MTSQIQEILIYKEITVGMASEPLDSYLSLVYDKPPFIALHTANWRGYVGEWLIEDDQLFIIGLQGLIKGDVEINMNYLFPNSEKVFAKWYSGTIRIPQGELLNYVHAGHESKYERDLYLELIKGKVVNFWLIENIEQDVADNVCVFEF